MFLLWKYKHFSDFFYLFFFLNLVPFGAIPLFLMKVFGVFLIAEYPVDRSVRPFIKTPTWGQILGTLQPNLEELFLRITFKSPLFIYLQYSSSRSAK